MKKIMIIPTILILFFSGICYAQGISFAVKGSTLGAGLEMNSPVSETIGLRIGLNYFPYSYSGTEDDIDYNFDLTLMSASLILDWHPFKGSFRLSGGALYNGNKIDADARSSATYEIGDTTYPGDAVGILTGNINFNDVAPYVGFGWDTSFGKKGLGFIFDIGVLYQGSPSVSLSANGPISNDPTFKENLSKEEDNLEDELKDYQFYPVVAIGIGYRF